MNESKLTREEPEDEIQQKLGYVTRELDELQRFLAANDDSNTNQNLVSDFNTVFQNEQSRNNIPASKYARSVIGQENEFRNSMPASRNDSVKIIPSEHFRKSVSLSISRSRDNGSTSRHETVFRKGVSMPKYELQSSRNAPKKHDCSKEKDANHSEPTVKMSGRSSPDVKAGDNPITTRANERSNFSQSNFKQPNISERSSNSYTNNNAQQTKNNVECSEMNQKQNTFINSTFTNEIKDKIQGFLEKSFDLKGNLRSPSPNPNLTPTKVTFAEESIFSDYPSESSKNQKFEEFLPIYLQEYIKEQVAIQLNEFEKNRLPYLFSCFQSQSGNNVLNWDSNSNISKESYSSHSGVEKNITTTNQAKPTSKIKPIIKTTSKYDKTKKPFITNKAEWASNSDSSPDPKSNIRSLEAFEKTDLGDELIKKLQKKLDQKKRLIKEMEDNKNIVEVTVPVKLKQYHKPTLASQLKKKAFY
jgi:hypothetical protein